MENRYENSKIYKIVDNGFNKTYIGSTTQPLAQRLADHRYNYRKYLNGKYSKTTVFSIFDEFGMDNCQIYLLEEYPCENRMQLHKKEGEYILNTDCVNKIVAGRTPQEYREQNKDKTAQYRKDNKDKLNQ